MVDKAVQTRRSTFHVSESRYHTSSLNLNVLDLGKHRSLEFIAAEKKAKSRSKSRIARCSCDFWQRSREIESRHSSEAKKVRTSSESAKRPCSPSISTWWFNVSTSICSSITLLIYSHGFHHVVHNRRYVDTSMQTHPDTSRFRLRRASLCDESCMLTRIPMIHSSQVARSLTSTSLLVFSALTVSLLLPRWAAPRRPSLLLLALPRTLRPTTPLSTLPARKSSSPFRNMQQDALSTNTYLHHNFWNG